MSSRPCSNNLQPTGADRTILLRLQVEIEARGCSHQPSQLSKAPRKKFRWRPRHTLKALVAAEVERAGLRLQLRKQQAEAGDYAHTLRPNSTNGCEMS